MYSKMRIADFLHIVHVSPSAKDRSKPFDSILDAIGDTPLVRMSRIEKAEGLKCELCEYEIVDILWPNFIAHLILFLIPNSVSLLLRNTAIDHIDTLILLAQLIQEYITYNCLSYPPLPGSSQSFDISKEIFFATLSRSHNRWHHSNINYYLFIRNEAFIQMSAGLKCYNYY